MRITKKWLRTRLGRMNLNTVTDTRLAELTPGAFVLNANAAGYSIALVVNASGAQQTLAHAKTPRALWLWISGFEYGLSKARRAHNG